jgi:hypothetical protein
MFVKHFMDLSSCSDEQRGRRHDGDTLKKYYGAVCLANDQESMI